MSKQGPEGEGGKMGGVSNSISKPILSKSKPCFHLFVCGQSHMPKSEQNWQIPVSVLTPSEPSLNRVSLRART